MKQKIILLALLLISVLAAPAENYPYRSDYLFVTVPDHADWLYRTGEKARISVEFYKYGIPRNGKLKYAIADDMLDDDVSGTVELKNGRAVIDAGTRRTPGFRDIRMSVEVDGTTYQHHIKVGFSPEKIQP